MAVLQCGGCDRFISVSMVAGGNPVALADPERWSTTRRICEGCERSFCDRCAAAARCPACSRPFASAAQAARPASTGARRTGRQEEETAALAGARSWITTAAILGAVWFLVRVQKMDMGAQATLYVACVAVGMWGAWRLLTAAQVQPGVRYLALALMLVPGLNVLALLGLRFWADRLIREAGLADAGMDSDTDDSVPPARAARPAANATSSAAAASSTPAPAQPERDLLLVAGEMLALVSGATLRPFHTVDFGRQKVPGTYSVLVPESGARHLITRLRIRFPPGFIAFMGSSRFLDDPSIQGMVELVVARGETQFDALRLAQTEPVNHGLGTEDVIARLQKYDRSFGVEVFQAETDSVLFKLGRLPGNLRAFCNDLHAFCPDTVEEGGEEIYASGLVESGGWVGLWWD